MRYQESFLSHPSLASDELCGRGPLSNSSLPPFLHLLNEIEKKILKNPHRSVKLTCSKSL